MTKCQVGQTRTIDGREVGGESRGTWQLLRLASIAFQTADSQPGTPRKTAIQDAASQGGVRGNLPLTLKGCLVSDSRGETVKLSVQPAHLG